MQSRNMILLSTCLRLISLLVLVISNIRAVPSSLDLIEEGATYRFEQFVLDYNRQYSTDEEFDKRKEIFESNLKSIVKHNFKYVTDRQNRLWATSNADESVLESTKDASSAELATKHLMGVNHFMDLLPEEIPKGYNSLQSSRIRNSYQRQQIRLSGAFNSSTAIVRNRRLAADLQQESEQKVLNALGGEYWSLDKLPKSVDWRTEGVTTPVKNQGGCGSCWAFASTAVLESHIAIKTGVLFEFSEQQFVSCALNPYHCGGSGGCTGATADVAYEHVMEHGIVEEWEFGYREYSGEPINCTLKPKETQTSQLFSTSDFTGVTSMLRRLKTRDVVDRNTSYYRGAVATIEGFGVLPSNNYLALLNVVARMGPVAVSVACLPWRFYQSGVFHAPLEPGKATDIDHLVVLEGYGTDEDTGENYWLIRNSWSPLWGEEGYIRLLRVGDSECSMDETPGDGDACTIDENGNPINPEPQKICGNSGILFDSVIPLGGSLVAK